MKRFVVGDIHGGYKALLQVLEKSNFDYEKDQLICLGDVADGWPEVAECFEELMKINNLEYILGNHDYWLLKWLEYGTQESIWTCQGGQASIDSFVTRMKDEGTYFNHRVLDLLSTRAQYYYETDDKKLFVHGGYNWHKPISKQDGEFLMWDRHLYNTACVWQQWYEENKPLFIAKNYDEVFIGHTSTCYSHPGCLPVHVSNVWNLDQGGGWEGRLTLMDIDTKEYWQSSIVKSLYPGVRGR